MKEYIAGLVRYIAVNHTAYISRRKELPMRLHFLILLLMACSPPNPRSGLPSDDGSLKAFKTPAQKHPVQPSAEQEEKQFALTKAATPKVVVGYTQIPSLPSKAEYKELQDALKIHRSGNNEASRDALLALWNRNSTNYGARYNLSCAQSRSGEFAEAAKHMQALLQEDLPHYRGRLEEDKDFEGLRKSPSYATLIRRIGELEPKWKEASDGGLPMIAWRGKLASKDGGYIRAGVWNAKTHRFVPLGRRVKNTIGAIVDLPNQRSLTVSRSKHVEVERDLGNITEFDLRLEVHPLYGESPAVFTMRPAIATELEAFPVADGMHLRWLADFGMIYLKNTLWRHVRSPVKRYAMETGQGYRLHIPEVPPRYFLYSQGSLAILRDGGQTNFPGHLRYRWTSGQTKGFRFRNNTLVLPDKRNVALSKGHGIGWANNLLLDSTNTYAWVVSQQGGCKHIVDRVHLPSGKVTLVSRGKGLAAARMHDGHLYLQLGETTKVFKASEDSWDYGKTLPSALGFVYPKCN